MGTLKYTIIKTKKQYNNYCNILESIVIRNSKADKDEVELLSLLIEKWDSDINSFSNLNPVELLKALMEANSLKPKDIVEILTLSKGTVSKILNYQKGLSKDTIRKLSSYFKVSQEAFNRPYKLINEINWRYRNTNLNNTRKKKVLA